MTKRKEINLLQYAKQLKEKANSICEEFEDDANMNKYAIYINNWGDKVFKTSYSGADICYSYIYDMYSNIRDIFNETDYFAAKAIKAKKYLENYIDELINSRDFNYELVYENWLNDHKEDEDNYKEYEDAAGNTYTKYNEPTYDDFVENMYTQEYSYDYESWNNQDEAIYILTESGDDLCIPNSYVYVY